jgi:hypothetical protein
MKLFKRISHFEVLEKAPVNSSHEKIFEVTADAQLASCEQQVVERVGDEKEVREELAQYLQKVFPCQDRECNGKGCEYCKADDILDLVRKPLVARIAILQKDVDYYKPTNEGLTQAVINAGIKIALLETEIAALTQEATNEKEK